jgi:hypothetical protein
MVTSGRAAYPYAAASVALNPDLCMRRGKDTAPYLRTIAATKAARIRMVTQTRSDLLRGVQFGNS